MVSLCTSIVNAISHYPREAASLFAAGMVGYGIMSLRNKIRQGQCMHAGFNSTSVQESVSLFYDDLIHYSAEWPIPIRNQGPHMTWLRPQG